VTAPPAAGRDGQRREDTLSRLISGRRYQRNGKVIE